MKIGPKYKIARRLGAPVFEKTQTPKYTLSLARKEKSMGRGRRGKPKSEYGLALIEKQKARFTYGIGEKQFKNYIDKALHSPQPIDALFSILESRLDSVLFRSGVAKTRSQARQVASHGHVLVNGTRVTIPSIMLSRGDTITLRAGSSDNALFREVAERMKTVAIPLWLKIDPLKRSVTVEGQALYLPQEQLFDLGKVIEFYSR